MKLTIPKLAFAMILCGSAEGALVYESETSGMVNNTPGTAQSIAAVDFTTPAPSTVFDPPGWATATISATGGNFDIDFFSFSTPGGGAMFDIDNSTFTFDTGLSLFDSAGTVIAFSDESLADDGSASIHDSFIGNITLLPGSYFIAVTRYPNFPNGLTTATGYMSLIRPDGKPGGEAVVGGAAGDSSYPSTGSDGTLPYTLHISLENAATAVPEASTFLIWSVLGTATVVALKARSWFSRKLVRSRLGVTTRSSLDHR